MNKFLLLFCCLLIVRLLPAQNLLINGNIVVNETSPEGAKIIIAKNNEKINEQVLNKKGHFDLKLALGADYNISFEKAGYITKIVNINTEVPEEIVESNPNFPPVKLIINLLPSVAGVNLSIFEQPIAILAYNHELDDFTFDKEYSDKIRTKIAQTEQEIKRKLSMQGAAASEEERKFAELVNKGQQAFGRKEWAGAIDSWTLALGMKPDNEEVKQKIASARKEAELEEARRGIELQNERAYKFLVASADSLFMRKDYIPAKEKFLAATKLNAQDGYPAGRIREINTILTAMAQKEADSQKLLAANTAAYQKAIAIADQFFTDKEYDKAIGSYRQALELKAGEAYPKERIAKAEQAKADLTKQQAADAEKKRIEDERRMAQRNKYAELIAEADAAFTGENYGLARLRYVDADNLNTGEVYPKKRIEEIDDIINSSKYKAKLAEYNKNKTLAEKNMLSHNYASARVYYQNAMAILPLDREVMLGKVAEIDRLIEVERLAAMEKEYKGHIAKADKAYQEKAYAVAKFYYQKALEAKSDDTYATGQLKEVEKYINDRQSKEAEL